MLSPENVATPPTAATVFVPDRVPVLGFVPIATVTFAVNPLAVLPLPSWAVIWTAGVISAPAVVVLGCTAKTSCVAAPAAMLNAALVVVTAPLAVRGEPAVAVSLLLPVEVGTRAAAGKGLVPDKV